MRPGIRFPPGAILSLRRMRALRSHGAGVALSKAGMVAAPSGQRQRRHAKPKSPEVCCKVDPIPPKYKIEEEPLGKLSPMRVIVSHFPIFPWKQLGLASAMETQ